MLQVGGGLQLFGMREMRDTIGVPTFIRSGYNM